MTTRRTSDADSSPYVLPEATRVEDSRVRADMRWSGNIAHYLGLIALMVGVGMLIATEVCKAPRQDRHVWFVAFRDKWNVHYRAEHIVGALHSSLVGPGVGALLGGLLIGVGACVHQRRLSKIRESAESVKHTGNSQGEHVRQDNLKWVERREWITRALVLIAALGIVFGIIALATTDNVTSAASPDKHSNMITGDYYLQPNQYDPGPIDYRIGKATSSRPGSTLHILNADALTRIRNAWLTLVIVGGGTAVVGFCCNKRAAKKLETVKSASDGL